MGAETKDLILFFVISSALSFSAFVVVACGKKPYLGLAETSTFLFLI